MRTASPPRIKPTGSAKRNSPSGPVTRSSPARRSGTFTTSSGYSRPPCYYDLARRDRTGLWPFESRDFVNLRRT